EVEVDRHRLPQDEAVVVDRRDMAVRVDLEKIGRAGLVPACADRHVLVIEPQLLRHPQGAKGARARDAIDLERHQLLLSRHSLVCRAILAGRAQPAARIVPGPRGREGASGAGWFSVSPNSRLGTSPHRGGWVMENTPAADRFVGIDVSKSWVDVHVRPDGTALRCNTDGAGLAELVRPGRPLTAP